MLNFREEARRCFQLGEAETESELRTVLFGMALGWLRLANYNESMHVGQIDLDRFSLGPARDGMTAA
jgi:hypothetical protein